MNMADSFDQKAFCTEAFRWIDTPCDNFKKIADVTTDLLFGDPTQIVEPWISIILPTFWRQQMFCDALDSILSQQEAGVSWECLVVDNTPLDGQGNTPALEAVRKCNDPHVLYYHNRVNVGSGYNWNRGVELARGKWICFLHDDDVLCTDALQNICRLLKKGRKANGNLGYLNARRVDFQGNFGHRCASEFRKHPQELLTRFGTLICGHTGAGAPTCGTVILKEAYMEVGGINYDFGLSADAVLCYQIMKRYAVVNTDCVIGGYRWDKNTTLTKRSLLDLIQTDDLLMSYVYSQTRISMLWGRWFGDAISWRNIWRKNNIAKENQIEISKKEFSDMSAYPEPKTVKKYLYLIFYAGYREWRLISGIF